MNERDELLTDLKAVSGELWPPRDPERMSVGDDVLALGVLLRREFRQDYRKADSPAMRGQFLVGLRHRDLDKLSKHDPKDAE